MKVGNKITVKNASWTFDKNVQNVFKHIKNSIPFIVRVMTSAYN